MEAETDYKHQTDIMISTTEYKVMAPMIYKDFRELVYLAEHV